MAKLPIKTGVKTGFQVYIGTLQIVKQLVTVLGLRRGTVGCGEPVAATDWSVCVCV